MNQTCYCQTGHFYMILVLLTTKRTSCVSYKEWEIRTRRTKDSVASISLSKIQCLTPKMFQVFQSSRKKKKYRKQQIKLKKQNKTEQKPNRISLLILLYKLFSGKTGLKIYGQRAVLSCGPILASLTYCHHWLTCSNTHMHTYLQSCARHPLGFFVCAEMPLPIQSLSYGHQCHEELFALLVLISLQAADKQYLFKCPQLHRSTKFFKNLKYITEFKSHLLNLDSL